MKVKNFRTVIIVSIVVLVCTGSYLAVAGQGLKGKDRVLSKVTFVHYRRGHGKPATKPGGKKPKTDEGYYSYIAKGTRWRVTEPFLLNPASDDDTASVDLVSAAVVSGMEEWEVYANADIFGDVVIDENIAYDDGEYRGINTISFGSYNNPDVIGVTTVWGYFTGPPRQREIIEAHILLNEDFVWGDADVDQTLMDVQNILTHELGHCAGMGDVYQDAAVEETMYGYSQEGETKKRDLYKGDITGISELYK